MKNTFLLKRGSTSKAEKNEQMTEGHTRVTACVPLCRVLTAGVAS